MRKRLTGHSLKSLHASILGQMRRPFRRGVVTFFEIDSEPYSSVFYRDGRSATLEVEDLVGKGWFQFPKNTDVLSELIELVTKPEDT